MKNNSYNEGLDNLLVNQQVGVYLINLFHRERSREILGLSILRKEEPMDVLYLCNRKKCENCSDECIHTKDVRYAKNFELQEHWSPSGEYFMYAVEKEPANNSTHIIGGKSK